MQSSVLLFAIALAISVGGCAVDKTPPPPPKPNRQVTLEVQQVDSPQPGYLTTYGSNGKMYAYRYAGPTGKDRGNINLKPDDGRDVIIELALNASATLSVDDVQFTDNDGQLSALLQNATRAQVHDKNTSPLNAYYLLKIKDNNAASPGYVYCDPGVVNN